MSIMNELLSDAEIFRDMPILVVDSDRDNRDLYASLLESYGAKVTTTGSVQAALSFLDESIPAIVICEVRFPGENVYALLQQVRNLELSRGRTIPILVAATCSAASLPEPLTAMVSAYLLKPVDIDCFVYEIWNLTHLSSIAYPPSIADWLMRQAIKTSYCCAGVR